MKKNDLIESPPHHVFKMPYLRLKNLFKNLVKNVKGMFALRQVLVTSHDLTTCTSLAPVCEYKLLSFCLLTSCFFSRFQVRHPNKLFPLVDMQQPQKKITYYVSCVVFKREGGGVASIKKSNAK